MQLSVLFVPKAMLVKTSGSPAVVCGPLGYVKPQHERRGSVCDCNCSPGARLVDSDRCARMIFIFVM